MAAAALILSGVAATSACGGSNSGDEVTASATEPSHTAEPAPTRDPASTARRAPGTITTEDDGSTFTLAVGDSVDLAAHNPLEPDPIVGGTSVELTEVANVAESGMREWEIRGVEPGETTITGTGAQNWAITIQVR